MKKLLLIGAINMLFFVSFGQCDIVYVALSGLPSASGAIGDPLDLKTAISTANDGDLIRVGTGIYDLDVSLTIPFDNIIIEGGFDDFNGWEKTSLAGATTINRTAVNPDGMMNDYRLVVVYAANISGFELHDITLTTDGATTPGTSTYGMHIDNCTNYFITRCQILPGNASDGTDGLDGANGADGSNGGNGANGDIDDNSSGGTGGTGGAGGGIGGGVLTPGGVNPVGGGNTGVAGPGGNDSSNPRAGGSGGGGGSGGETDNNGGFGGTGGGVNLGANQTGGGGYGTWGDPGGDGSDGAAGSAGSLGSNGVYGGAPLYNQFFVVGSVATDGTDGGGGRGGVGGGGGGGQSCFFCDDGSGDGGGGGGGGAEGGEAGTGGYGAGASFGIYLFSNGVNGVVQNSYIAAGAAGQGGTAGLGGSGGTGGANGLGSTYGTAEVGEGGNGGDGGDGGNGGNGGSGADGISQDIRVATGDALATQETMFDLAAMPEITATYATCTNQNMTFTNVDVPLGGGTTSWDFSGNSFPQSSSMNPSVTEFTVTGQHDVIEGVNTYMDFIYITCSVDASASQLGTVLTATAQSATYQWIDCNTGSALTGQTNQVYNATMDGDYAVIVTENTCTDTSECFNVDFTALEDLSMSEFNVYPNPVTDVLTMDFNSAVNGEIKIYDVTMKLIDAIEVSETSSVEYTMNVPSGVYTIEFISDDKRTIRRVVKK